jgi:hypothetical protein
VGRTPALSFEERIRRDTLSTILVVETSIILAASFLAAALLRQHPALIITLGAAASASLIITLAREVARSGRRLALAEVKSIKQLGYNNTLFLPWSPMFTLAWSWYEVEVYANNAGKVFFIDWRPHRVGDRILVLVDRSGKVVAVNSLRQPVSVERLRKLA